jgi:Spy/CpxP family protein refolding chaperone
MRMCLALALSALLAIPAFAQPPGGGRGMRGGGSLLTNKSVQEELKITEEQATKIKEFTTEVNKDRPKFDPNGDVDEQRKAGQEFGKKVATATAKFAKETLTPDQQKRYTEISIQRAGLLPGMMGMGPTEDTMKALKITDEQKTSLKEIADTVQKDMQELRQGGGGRDPEAQKKMAAIQKEASDKAKGLLTDEQKKMWTDLTGKAFEYKADAPAGRRPPPPPA